MSEFILLSLSRTKDNVLRKIVLSNNEVRVDGDKYLLEDMVLVEAEISDHVRIYEYLSGGNYVEKILPIGSIRVRFRNDVEIVIETLNPLVKLEDLVIKINKIYSDQGLSRFGLVESGVYRVVYKRGG